VPWDAAEEAQCLGDLADADKRTEAKLKEPGQMKVVRARSPAFDRLVAAHDQGFIAEFVVYEVQSRIEPEVTLTMTAQERERVRLYVERFVLGVPPAQ
jgi:hypothetical protein